MKTLERKIELKPFDNKIFDYFFKDMKIAVFDLETTGLSPSSGGIILSGILLINGTEGTVIQHFAETLSDEPAVIAATIETLKDVDAVITYNGQHFDIPFMEKRMTSCEMKYSAKDLPLYNLDLYLVLNGHSHLRDFLPDLKQKTIEIFMGIAAGRDDEISGSESVSFYASYERNHDPDLEKKILLHNSDDVEQLYKLLPVITKADFYKAMYKIGFPIKSSKPEFPDTVVNKIVMDSKELVLKGKQKGNLLDYLAFATEENPYSVAFSKDLREWEIKVPIQKKMGAFIVNAAAISPDYKELSVFPTYESGFLILKLGPDMNYQEAIALSKLVLKAVENRI